MAMAISPDTLLRRVKRLKSTPAEPPRVVGIDDWAWRKGQCYGTIVVDLERSDVIDLLPDREADTVAGWLKEHPGIEVVSRDRSATYAEAEKNLRLIAFAGRLEKEGHLHLLARAYFKHGGSYAQWLAEAKPLDRDYLRNFPDGPFLAAAMRMSSPISWSVGRMTEPSSYCETAGRRLPRTARFC